MVCGCRWANVVENEHFQALGQMGTKKAKMAMEEVPGRPAALAVVLGALGCFGSIPGSP